MEVKQRSVRRPELEYDSKSLSLHVLHCLCNQRTVKVLVVSFLYTGDHTNTSAIVDNMQQDVRTFKEMLETVTDHSMCSCFIDATSCSL